MSLETLIEGLKNCLSEDRIITGEDLKSRYNHIWRMNEGLDCKALVMPVNTTEVSSIMKLAYSLNQSVVVFGGLTNLVGATLTSRDNLVVSMEKMNSIEEIDPASRTMSVQGGVILQNVHELAEEHDLLFPMNFGAKGSAQIGGIISSNAGGLRVFRYGMMRNLVLGLEVVLADGTIINSMKKIIKDNSAYDIKQLFIGSEGTLGVVCRAVLKLIEKPISRCSAFVAFNEYDKVVDFLKLTDKRSGGILSGYELIWSETYRALTSPPSQYKPPLEQHYKYYVLLEFLGSDQFRDQELLMQVLEDALNINAIEDAALAMSDSDMNWFWSIREDVHTFVSLCKYDQHFDISLPISEIGNYVDQVTEELLNQDEVEYVFPFGHVADGNVHFVVGKLNNSKELTLIVNQIVYEPLRQLRGSVSAEHGIGFDKKAYLSVVRSPEEIELMETIKKALDPKGLLNPGKVLDMH